jgi:RHS repeat-associated protein
MKKLVIIIISIIFITKIYGQDPATTFTLSEPVPADITQDWVASEFVNFTYTSIPHPGSNFSTAPDINNYVRASIDPFFVEEPSGGGAGGPNPGDEGIVGAVPGSLSVSGSGAAIYSIPIEVAPGTSGMTPEISLVYNSNGQDGIIGPGWSIGGISAISNVRQTEYYTGYLNPFNLYSYFNSTEFSLDGQKLIRVGSHTSYQSGEYRTEDESFRQINKEPRGDGWCFKTKTKSGLYYEYGLTNDSRQWSSEATHAPQRAILNYFVNKISDRLGNEIVFNYTSIPATGECYIASIVYGDGKSKVTFEYKDRETSIVTRVQDHTEELVFKVSKRLWKIHSSYNNQIYRTYNLNYTPRGTTQISYLNNVELIGENKTKYNPTIFDWPELPESLYEFEIEEDIAEASGKPISGDFNGDGLIDICFQQSMGAVRPLPEQYHGNFICFKQNNGNNTFTDMPTISNHVNHLQQQVHVADFNGDGISDVLLTVIEDMNHHLLGDLYLFDKDFNYTLYPQIISYNEGFDYYRVDVGDFNGDGQADVMVNPSGAGSDCFYGNENTSIPLVPATTNEIDGWPFMPVEDNVVFADFNGNGRTDMLKLNTVNGSDLYINEISDWGEHPYVVSIDFQDDDEFLLGDFNGDMIADICIIKNNQDFSIYQSYGAGFSKTVDNKNVPLSSSSRYNTVEFDYFIGDFNGDNISDLLRSNYSVDIPDIEPEITSNFTILITNTSGHELIVVSDNEDDYSGIEYAVSLIGDFNNDGRSDIFCDIAPICYMYDDDPRKCNYYIMKHDFGNRLFQLNETINKISAITNGVGVTQDIEYKPLIGSDRTGGETPSYPIAYLPGQLLTVSNIHTYGDTYINSTYYEFKNPRVHMQGKGLMGFLSTKTRTWQSYGVEIVEETDYEIDNDYYYLIPEYSKKYIEEATKSNQSKQNLEGKATITIISESYNVFDKHRYFDNVLNTESKRYFPFLEQTLIKLYEIDGSLVKIARTDFGYTVWGDLQYSHSYQDNDPSLSLTSPTSSFEFAEINTNSYYDADVTNWILGRLKNTYVKHQKTGSDDITRSSYFEYYTDGSFMGMLKKEHQEPWGAKTLSKEYFYKDIGLGKGNLVKTIQRGTDMNDREYSTQYDANGRFIESTINPLDHSDYKEYHPFTGSATYFKDLNGLEVLNNYDNLGRLYKTTNPDGSLSVSAIRWVTSGDEDAPTSDIEACYYTWGKSSGGPATKQYFDKYGRELRSVAIGLNNEKVYVDKAYNTNSTLKTVTEPYFKNGGSPDIYTEYKYDNLNRVYQQILPGNRITTTQYNGLETTIINPAQQNNTKVINVAGWLVESIDANSKSNTYEYYSNGLLNKIIDPNNNTTELVYDIFGNRTFLNDPDLGSTSFAYNPIGELLSKTDANFNYASYEYDLLGRLEYTHEPEGVTHYIYDLAENGIGKIASIDAPNITKAFHYDELSRLFQTDEEFGGESFTTKSTFDVLGRPKTLTYPSGYEVRNVYDNNSYLKQVIQYDNGKVLWQVNNMNARGQYTEFSLGNGITTNHEYDANTGWITAISTSNFQDMEFDWYDIANLKYRADNSKSIFLKEEFLYDNLNRLDNIIMNGILTLDMEYDDIGNITYKSDVGNYSYDDPQPHAVSSINGNELPISLLLQDIQYTSFDKIQHIEEGENSLHVLYGTSHERIQMANFRNGVVTKQKYYVGGGIYEKVIENGVEKQVHYLTGGTGLFAILTIQAEKSEEGENTSSQVFEYRYVHTDHLGSIQCISNENGFLVEEYSYDAWGKRRDPLTLIAFDEPPTLAIDRGFTGHEHLDLFDLVNMNGRIYDPVIGRFLSADPYSQMPEHTQGLNRYSYVMNNPLSFTDPSGYTMEEAGFASFMGLIAGTIVMAAITVGTAGVAAPVAIGLLSGFAAGFTAGATGAILNGATFSQAMGAGMIGGVIGAAMGAATAGIGSIAVPCSGMTQMTANSLNFLNLLIRSSAHAALNGGMRLIQGGRVELGLMSAFFSSMAMGGAGMVNNMSSLGYMIIGAAVGGTAEALGGGKFANGAITGAFVGLFNHGLHSGQNSQTSVESIYQHSLVQIFLSVSGH